MDYKLLILPALLLAGLVWAAWKSWPERKPYLCPKCSGELVSDPGHYRYMVLHTCKDCGSTFETPK